MDPVGQGSFIPKQSLTAVDRGGGVGLFLLLSIIIFLMSLIAAGAAFGYQQVLNRTIAAKVLKDVVVSGVSVNEKGKVSFSVNATVDPTLILYKNNLVQSAAQSASSTQ